MIAQGPVGYSSRCASNQPLRTIKAGFTISLGCRENPANRNQRCAPLASCPQTRMKNIRARLTIKTSVANRRAQVRSSMLTTTMMVAPKPAKQT